VAIDSDGFPRLGVVKGGANEHPLNAFWKVLQEAHDFDTIHRRAGGEAAAPRAKDGGYYGHSDGHKNCAGYSCGKRGREGQARAKKDGEKRTARITAWRKAKAWANRAYLEEKVYGKPK